MSRASEEARIRYLYRDLVLKGKLKLPFEAAKMLIGPDCAYHLYRVTEFGSGPRKTGNAVKSKKNKTQ